MSTEQNGDDRARDARDRGRRVELDLDGGEVALATGVGFFDHMLELLGRHGELGLVVRATGDLETGAHHTVEDVGIALGQALDEALGDRAGIRRYGYAVVPMDEALAECAIDISGRPFCRFDAELPPVTIAGFDAELAEEFFRAVAANAKLTAAPRHPLRLQRPPPDRGLLQGVRARPARGGRDRSGRGRGAVHEGDAELTRIAILDYGMGNLRSVEKALERVGAEAVDHARRRASRGRPTAWSCRASGAFAKAMERIDELGLDALIAERVEAGTPVLGICLGFQLLFESSTELGGARGLGLIEGEVERARGARAQGAAHRLGARRLDATLGAHRRDRRRDAVLLRPQLRPAGRARRGRRARPRPTHGERFACAIERPPIYGVQFHPEKSSAAGLRLLANFAAICSPVPA